MTFDMSQCKVGDKLKTRGGYMVSVLCIDDHDAYPYKIRESRVCNYFVTSEGYKWASKEETCSDIIGFWEGGQLSEDDESFPNIEVRTPQIEKITIYRVHFNEMFHRDLSEEEAKAIYQQLKELLGEKNND
jgi:hypothetical protein